MLRSANGAVETETETMQTIELLGIDHVQLAAPPGMLAAARSYFSELLGLTELPRPEDMKDREGIWFRLGAQELHIGAETTFVPARKAHVAIRLRDGAAVRLLAERLEAAGKTVRWAKDAPGYTRFHTDDPWGNRLEFTAP